jgi:hypothetical protein
MIPTDELKGLRYYIISAILLLSLFIYSDIIGWNWFNDTSTEQTRMHRVHSNGRYFYHK